MKKRLRKKLYRGEFKQLGFVMTATYEEKADMDTLGAFVDEILAKFEELNLDGSGYFDFADFDVLVNTGSPDTDEAARRQQAIDFVKALPGVKEVNASELVDAWHNSL